MNQYKKKYDFGLKIFMTTIGVALSIYILVNPLDVLLKVAFINFIAFMTTQLFILGKKQLRLANIIWLVISLLLFLLWVLVSTGSI